MEIGSVDQGDDNLRPTALVGLGSSPSRQLQSKPSHTMSKKQLKPNMTRPLNPKKTIWSAETLLVTIPWATTTNA